MEFGWDWSELRPIWPVVGGVFSGLLNGVICSLEGHSEIRIARGWCELQVEETCRHQSVDEP